MLEKELYNQNISYHELHRVTPAFIAKLRRDMGLSMAKFGQVFGISSPQVLRYENGQSFPDNIKKAMMIKLRGKIDADRRRQKDTGEKVAQLVVTGGIIALLIWLFSETKK